MGRWVGGHRYSSGRFGGKKYTLPPTGNRNPVPPPSSQYPCHYTTLYQLTYRHKNRYVKYSSRIRQVSSWEWPPMAWNSYHRSWKSTNWHKTKRPVGELTEWSHMVISQPTSYPSGQVVRHIYCIHHSAHMSTRMCLWCKSAVKIELCTEDISPVCSISVAKDTQVEPSTER